MEPTDPIGGLPVLVEKRTSEHDQARFGSVTVGLSAVQVGRPLRRWILISITVALLLLFLVLSLKKNPLRIFREDPPGQGRGAAMQAMKVGETGPVGLESDTPSLGPGAIRVPPQDLRISILRDGSTRIPAVQVQGLADGEPPVCWVPRADGERLVIDAGKELSWSHVLLYRCSLPTAAVGPVVEVTVEISIPGRARSRILRLRGEDAPTRVDLGGLLSDKLILTLRPSHVNAGGLSGVVGFHFEGPEQ